MSTLFNLGDLLNRENDTEKAALIDLSRPEGARTFSHAEIDNASQAVARGLVARGLRRGERVAILSANRMEFLTAYFGTMRAGLVSVPINYKFPNETVDYLLRDADIKLVFADKDRAASIPSDIRVVNFDNNGPDGFEALSDPGEFESIRPTRDEIAMFLYTSGSTGRPKGVPLTHEGHLWVVKVRIDPPPDADHRVLVAAPLYHMNGLAMCKLAVGAHLTIVLMPQFTAAGYVEAIGQYGVTWLTSVPTMLAMVSRERQALASTDLSSVRIARMGSAPVSQKLYEDLREIFPNALITNGYGTTEGGPACYGAHPDGLPQPGMSIGYPRPDCDARLVDGDNLDADQGILQCRNPSVMPGYHNLPEKSAEVLSPDGWYDTGDIMRRDENGFHYFVGRADDMFNCGGENIYPAEVEKMLEKHPDIEQACVVPVADEIKGYKPSAFVVPVRGKTLQEHTVKEYALANGPAYQHPRQVEFLLSLPLTGTNKIDRKALTQRAAQAVRETAQ